MMRKIQKLYELKIKTAQKLYNFLFTACIHSFFKCLNIMEAKDRINISLMDQLWRQPKCWVAKYVKDNR